MDFVKCLLLLKITFWLITGSVGSYLETPRIHFAGHYRADAETINNMPCNFDVDLNYDPNTNANWNGMGTNEIAFQDTEVYGAVNSNGKIVSDEKEDAVIGASVMDNGKAPFAKMVIQDVDTENTTAIYGLRFGIGWKQDVPGEQNSAFYGKWEPNIISQMLWHKVKCYDDSMDQDTFPRGALATTTLTNVTWKEGDLNSSVLEDLRTKSIENGNTLQVSLMFYFYTRNHKDYVNVNFTLGYVVGTVGVYRKGEPLNYGGERLLVPFEGGAAPPSIVFNKNDSCYGQNPNLFKPWMYKAPFIVNQDTSTLSIDLSNSLPISNHSVLRNIGKLYIVVMHGSNKFELLGEVPYLDENWLWNTGGIVDFNLSSTVMKYVLANPSIAAVIEDPKGTVKEFGDHLLIEAGTDHNYVIMLQEELYYIRPQGFYNSRLEKNDTFDLSLIVSTLGRPAEGIQTIVKGYIKPEMPPLPENGVVVLSKSTGQIKDTSYAKSVTNSKGIANFTFKVLEEMSPIRTYTQSPCAQGQTNVTQLPIDGQSYQFKYSVCKEDRECQAIDISEVDVTPISVRAFSSNTASPPYKWKTDIYPIFRQYYHLYPVMSSIVNLTNLTSVAKYTNLKMILHSMTVDFDDPNFMPATRDLPKSKQQMIIEWLKYMLKFYTEPRGFIRADAVDNPFNSHELVEIPTCTPIKRKVAVSFFEEHTSADVCEYKAIPINPDDMCSYTDAYYTELILEENEEEICTRPLDGYSKYSKDPNIQKMCTKENVQDQLQLAIQLEFSTIPIYLTTLYSLVKECNEEIYNIIRSVVMQEMLHFIQAANILVATGKDPLIDDKSFVPTFPREGLPGCCHPNLKVYLGKFNMEIMHNLFVAIERPNITCVATGYPDLSNNTIGQFYNEITECIEHLNETNVNIFVSDSKQVSWPWPILKNSPLGQLYSVYDTNTSILGIKEIVEQGEGASPIDPYDNDDNQLAHYYKFQEIVCKRHLKNDGQHYAYNGDKIRFDSRGVYNMRPNPRSETIKPRTNCYTEAKTFHHIFRALLRELQVSFSGKPDNIMKAMELMEAMQVHLKRVMRVLYDTDSREKIDEQTCGPVWDYIWEDCSFC